MGWKLTDTTLPTTTRTPATAPGPLAPLRGLEECMTTDTENNRQSPMKRGGSPPGQASPDPIASPPTGPSFPHSYPSFSHVLLLALLMASLRVYSREYTICTYLIKPFFFVGFARRALDMRQFTDNIFKLVSDHHVEYQCRIQRRVTGCCLNE